MVKLARTFGLLEPLRERIRAGLPVYGSCAGMILLADRVDTGGSPLEDTIGGLDITVRRNAFGRQVDSFEEDVTIDGVDGGPVHAVFIRAPWVQEVGPKATALGTHLGRARDRGAAGAAAGDVVPPRDDRRRSGARVLLRHGGRPAHAVVSSMPRPTRRAPLGADRRRARPRRACRGAAHDRRSAHPAERARAMSPPADRATGRRRPESSPAVGEPAPTKRDKPSTATDLAGLFLYVLGVLGVVLGAGRAHRRSCGR